MRRFSSFIKRLSVIGGILLLSVGGIYATPGKTISKSHRAAAKHTTATSTKKSKHSLKAVSGKSKSSRTSRRRSTRVRGQQSIQSDRAREIQEALIREKYLEGEPSGNWDQKTKDAMTKYQKDNGWQSKVVPDSRALIKLGLGPNHDNVINPETSGIRIESPAANDPAPRMQPGGSIAN